MEKRGLTHIEMILSFVIFIGFLVLALYFFNPLKADRLLSSSVYYAEDEIIDRLSINIESYSVVLEESGGGALRIPIENPNGWNVRVETNNGTSLASEYDEDEVIFDNPGGNNFVKIMFAEDFPAGSVSGSVGEVEHTIASFDEREVLSEKRALELNESYYSSYVELKQEFNLPGRIDFSFQIIFDGGEISAQREIPDGLDVFARDKRVEIIRQDGSIEFADLNVKVW